MASPSSPPPVSAYAYVSLGFEFLAAFAMFSLGGWGLDAWLGTLPIFLIVGLFAGFAGGLWHILRRSAALGSAYEEQIKREAEPAPESLTERMARVEKELGETETRLQRFFDDRKDDRS